MDLDNTLETVGAPLTPTDREILKLWDNWKQELTLSPDGYYVVNPQLTKGVPVRLFLSEKLLEDTENNIGPQIFNATKFPGVKLVVITPDVHHGYGVPVGCVILTDRKDGAVAMGPVGFDIGCFTGKTLVPLTDGKSYSMKELSERQESFWVYSIGTDLNITVAEATSKLTREKASLVRIILDNKEEIVCTPDHKFMLRDGHYREAKDLTPDVSLMPFYSRSDKDGYTVVRQPQSDSEQRVHWIMAREGLLGEIPSFAPQQTIIHHKDFTPWNNIPENLEFMGHSDHMSYHRGIVERNTHFQGKEFEKCRKAALAAKAATPEGHAYFAARGTKNILKYMQENRGEFLQAVAGNGERGKEYLSAYNTSEKGRAKSSEIAHREYTCEVCGEKAVGGFGIHLHRKKIHSFNHKVLSIEFLEEREDVYCLTVPEYGNFALSAGVFVHNCGMISARSSVDFHLATPDKRLAFNRELEQRVGSGVGQSSLTQLASLSEKEFEAIVREGAPRYIEQYGLRVNRERSERDFLEVDDKWEIPKSAISRGKTQLGTIGSGNHFAEVQHMVLDDTIFVQVHTGSRGFGHALATHYFNVAKEEKPGEIKDIDLGFFTPDSPNYQDYLNAVSAGANFAIVNRLAIFEQVAIAFRRVFGEDLELVYEISHNLVQKENHPKFGDVWVHRKGATRAFPAGHPFLKNTVWEKEGHPILIPGSNQDFSYILRPESGAVKSAYSVNHGAGRRMSRGEAKRSLSQNKVNKDYKRLGIVVNTGGNVPIDESGACYKPAQEVIDAVVDAGLARIEYKLWPLASFKATDELKGWRRKKENKYEKRKAGSKGYVR